MKKRFLPSTIITILAAFTSHVQEIEAFLPTIKANLNTVTIFRSKEEIPFIYARI